MKLSEIYSQKIDHLKTVKFGESEIKVKLFMQDEAEAFGEMVLDETRIDEFWLSLFLRVKNHCLTMARLIYLKTCLMLINAIL